jgi:hypothetical protein
VAIESEGRDARAPPAQKRNQRPGFPRRRRCFPTDPSFRDDLVKDQCPGSSSFCGKIFFEGGRLGINVHSDRTILISRDSLNSKIDKNKQKNQGSTAALSGFVFVFSSSNLAQTLLTSGATRILRVVPRRDAHATSNCCTTCCFLLA